MDESTLRTILLSREDIRREAVLEQEEVEWSLVQKRRELSLVLQTHTVRDGAIKRREELRTAVSGVEDEEQYKRYLILSRQTAERTECHVNYLEECWGLLAISLDELPCSEARERELVGADEYECFKSMTAVAYLERIMSECACPDPRLLRKNLARQEFTGREKIVVVEKAEISEILLLEVKRKFENERWRLECSEERMRDTVVVVQKEGLAALHEKYSRLAVNAEARAQASRDEQVGFQSFASQTRAYTCALQLVAGLLFSDSGLR
ncbi:hypothetical protein DIPPA_63509, partial [Diplonema papillatum]